MVNIGSNETWQPPTAKEMAIGQEMVEDLKSGHKIEAVFKKMDERCIAEGNNPVSICDCVFTQIAELQGTEKQLVKRVDNLMFQTLMPGKEATAATGNSQRRDLIARLLTRRDPDEILEDAASLRHLCISDRAEIFAKVNQAKYLGEHSGPFFSELGLVEAPFALCSTIATQGGSALSGLLMHFSKLGFVKGIAETEDVEQKFILCKKLILEGQWVADGLPIYFDTLGLKSLTMSQRKELCSIIVKNGFSGSEILKECFDKLGFIEDVNKLKSLNEKIALCKEIASLGSWAMYGLSNNFFKLGLVPEDAPVDEKVALCMKIASEGSWAGLGLLNAFDKLGLAEASVGTRYKLCKAIVSNNRNTSLATPLTTNFEKLGLKNASFGDRFKFYSLIASVGQFAGTVMVDQLDSLNLEGATLDQRLELYNLIASKGYQGREVLKNSFTKLGLLEEVKKAKSETEQFALCKKIASQGEWGAYGIAHHFDRLELKSSSIDHRLELYAWIGKDETSLAIYQFSNWGFVEDINKCEEINDKLALCKKIAEQGDPVAAGLAWNIEKIKLDGASIDQRMDLCSVIASQGGTAAKHMPEKLDEFRLQEAPIDRRLGLYKLIAAQGEAASKLANSFTKLGLIEDVNKCKRLEERLELCKKIAGQGRWAAQGLGQNLDKVNLEEATLDQRVELYSLIASQGEQAAEDFANNLAQMGLEKATTVQRLALFNLIASQGDGAAKRLGYSLAYGSGKALLEGITTAERIKLFMLIAAQGNDASHAIDFQEHGLNEMTLEQRLALSNLMASHGSMAAMRLSDHFDEWGFVQLIKDCNKLEERLTLCKKLASQGEWAASGLAKYFYKLGLEEATPDQRLELCQLIAVKGGGAKLADNISALGLSETSVKKRIELCTSIASNGESATVLLLTNFSKMQLVSATVEQLIPFLRVTAQNNPHATKVFILSIPVANVREQLVLESSIIPDIGPISLKEIQPLLDVISFKLSGENAEDLKDEEERFNIFAEKMTPYFQEPSRVSFLVGIFKDIGKLSPLRTRVLLTQWLAYLAGVLNQLAPQQLKLIQNSPILADIQAFRNPVARYTLVRALSMVLTQKEGHVLSVPAKNDFARLSSIPFSQLIGAGMSKEAATQFVKLIDGKKSAFNDTWKVNELLKFLVFISEQAPFTEQELELLNSHLTKILNGQNKQIPKEIVTLNSILGIFGRKRFFECLATNKKYEEFFLDTFNELFPIGKIDNFQEQYEKTLGKFRNPFALYAYLRSVQKLSKNESEAVHALLSGYVAAVLTEKFPAVRYDTADQPHLAHVFKESKGVSGSWLQTAPPQPVERSAATAPLDSKAFLKQKIIQDEHIDPDEYPVLRDFLNGADLNIESELSNAEPKKARLQHLLINLCREPAKFKETLDEIDDLQLPLGEFANDLRALRKQLQPVKGSGFQVMESDNACDLLLIGTEIDGSCQRVDGDPHLNKCLAAYLMQGEIRVIAVKDAEGKLIARSVLRLFWDDKHNTPVLLQERLYSNVQDYSFKEAINKWAVEKAKAMGVPLVSSEVGEGTPYTGNVKFLGGRAPFMYSDASGGVMRGPFETKGTHLLYEPVKK